MPHKDRLGSSFRDPSGFIYVRDGLLLRQVNRQYAEALARLVDSGLYAKITEAGLLVKQEEVDLGLAHSEGAIAVLKPDRIPTISYPYEWCFSQFKAAALAT